MPLVSACAAQGTCGLCFVNVDGEEVAACLAVCPKKDATIEYMNEERAKEYAKEIAMAAAAKRKAARASGQSPPDAEAEEAPQLSYRERMEKQMLEAMEAEQQQKKKWPFG